MPVRVRFCLLSAQRARYAGFRSARPCRKANVHRCGKHPLFAAKFLGLSDQFFGRAPETRLALVRAWSLDQRGYDGSAGEFCWRRPAQGNLLVAAHAVSA